MPKFLAGSTIRRFGGVGVGMLDLGLVPWNDRFLEY